MIDKFMPTSAGVPASPTDKPLRSEPGDRHFLFNCHRIAMDFGIHAALRALELNAAPPKNTA